MKKFVQLTCTVIGLEFLVDGPIFFGIARCQKRGSIVCKDRRIEGAKTKISSLFIKYLQIAFLKAIQPLQWNSIPW